MEASLKLKKYKSFSNGVGQLKRESFQSFKKEVMMFLAMKSDSTYYSKMRGERPMSPSDMATIERIFKKYGVTQNIWSEPIKKVKPKIKQS